MFDDRPRHRPLKESSMLRHSVTAARLVGARAVPALASTPARSALALVSQRRWNQQAVAESHIFDDNDHLRRRLLYRSKQRGWLEMDIMLGNWVRVTFFTETRLPLVFAKEDLTLRVARRHATTLARSARRS